MSAQDLGHGVRVEWLWKGDTIVGVLESHEPGTSGCDPQLHPDHDGVIYVAPEFEARRPHWTVDAGTLGTWEGLTLSPSVLRRQCGLHGWIRDGRWVPA